jgi:hypothetical protein
MKSVAHPGTSTCDLCGSRGVDHHICCLLSPKKAQGWCAWCGENVPGGRRFCNQKCSQAYARDAVMDIA